MPLSNYIGQYGESLRRLSALNQPFGAQQPQVAPQSMGGADMGVLPPPAMPGQIQRNAQGAQMSVDQSGGPAGALPAAPPAQGAPALTGGGGALGPATDPNSPTGSPPGNAIGLKDIIGASSTAQKEAALKNLEKHVNVDDEFGALQEHGIIPKEDKMSRHEKGMLVLEFGLRMMSATAQGADAAGAAGIAGQGLLESYRATKDADKKEATRQSERSQDRQDKLNEQASAHNDKSIEGNQRQAISYQEQAGASNRNNADIKSREKIADLEAKTRMNEARIRAKTEKQPMHFTDKDGNLKLVDAQGNVTTPTEDTVDAKTGKKVRSPVKPMQKADASGIDQDKVQALIEAEKKRLAEDSATSRDMRKRGLNAQQQNAELEKQARKNILGRLPVGANTGDPLNLGLE